MDDATRLQTGPADVLRSLVIESYAWLVTLSFGATLLDIVYARSVPGAAAGFSDASDFLLLIGALTVPAAVVAIGLSWQAKIARYFFLASLIISLLGFVAPVVFSPLLLGDVGPGVGSALRIAITGLPSVLAFIGLFGFYRRG